MRETEPMVQLSGDIFDLDSLQWWSAQSKSPLYSVVKQNEKYWLKSPRFGLHTDYNALRAEAKKLIPIIKVSAKVRGMNMQSIGVGSDVSLGGRPQDPTHVVIDVATISEKIMMWKENGIFYFKFNDWVREIGPEIGPNFALIEDNILELGARMKKGLLLDSSLHQLENRMDDPYLYETFSYLVEEPSWYNLYNTYEMIKFDTDKTLKEGGFDKKACKITKQGWAEPNELKKFKRAANDPHAEGGGRHSSAFYKDKKAQKRERKGKPNSYWELKDKLRKERRENDASTSQPMSLFEANALITRIFRGWCKYNTSRYEVKTRLSSAVLAARSIMVYVSSSNHSSKNHSGK